jgi:Protein of unknown function (DUF2917)
MITGGNAMLNTKQKIHNSTEISLAEHKLWSIEGDRRGDVISCLSGTLWITQQVDLNDYMLEAGKSFWVTKPGAVVVQALDNAQFKYSLNELESHGETELQPNRRSAHTHLSNPLR